MAIGDDGAAGAVQRIADLDDDGALSDAEGGSVEPELEDLDRELVEAEWQEGDAACSLAVRGVRKLVTAVGEGLPIGEDWRNIRGHVAISLARPRAPLISTTRGPRRSNQPTSIHLDELLPGVQLALLSMRVGERAVFWIAPPLAYDALGEPSVGIPPNAALKVWIHLVGAEPPAEAPLPPGGSLEERLAKAEECRAEGKGHFERGAFRQAAKCFNRGLAQLVGANLPDTPERRELAAALRTNAAAAELRLGAHAKAAGLCEQVLRDFPGRAKARYLRAAAWAAGPAPGPPPPPLSSPPSPASSPPTPWHAPPAPPAFGLGRRLLSGRGRRCGSGWRRRGRGRPRRSGAPAPPWPASSSADVDLASARRPALSS
eukprot:tig00001388_g8581.t1